MEFSLHLSSLSLSLSRSENNETHEELFKQIGHDYTVTVYIYAMSP